MSGGVKKLKKESHDTSLVRTFGSAPRLPAFPIFFITLTHVFLPACHLMVLLSIKTRYDCALSENVYSFFSTLPAHF